MAAFSFHLQTYMANITPTQDYFFSIAYGLISALGLLGNGLVLVAVWRRPKMRTGPNLLIGNLAVSNLLLALFLYPLIWQSNKTRRFPYGRAVCKIATAFPGSNIYCSTLTICLITVNRYFTASSKRSDMLASNRQIVSTLAKALVVWLMALAFSTPLMVYYDIQHYPPDWHTLPLYPNGTGSFSWPQCLLAPHHSENTYRNISIGINASQVAFLYLIPLVILVVFNWKLSQIVVRSGRRAQRGRQDRARKEYRMRLLLILMASSYAVLWLPSTVITALFDFGLLSDQLNRWIDSGSKITSMLSICLNPFLYGYLNTNLNRELKRMFTCWGSSIGSEAERGATTTAGDTTRLVVRNRSELQQNGRQATSTQQGTGGRIRRKLGIGASGSKMKMVSSGRNLAQLQLEKDGSLVANGETTL